MRQKIPFKRALPTNFEPQHLSLFQNALEGSFERAHAVMVKNATILQDTVFAPGNLNSIPSTPTGPTWGYHSFQKEWQIRW
ncbi:hypothetical protein [Algoriphagus hitonicola]|uniref:hypothetical protein n=1 Tax=Algoriphagus hitonicola TaxID=435880 RepID=UPI00361B71AF